MRRWVALSGLLVAVAACAPGDSAVTTTTIGTTTTSPAITTTSLAPTTTTAPTAGGHLVRLDMGTLQPMAALEPIPIPADSWSFLSDDGSVWVNVECEQNLCALARGVDVDSWKSWGPVDVGWHVERTASVSTFYGYDGRAGSTGRGLFSVDLITGGESRLAEWRDALYFWDGLHVLAGGMITGLGATSPPIGQVAEYSAYIYDPQSGEERVVAVGPLDRSDWHSGVFDGEYEIPIFDSPGVAWGDDRVLIADAGNLEVTEVDLISGSVETHRVEVSSWLDRLLAFWMPTAAAKGPSMGTYSSAALSPDGRFLFVSGNRMDVEKSEAGGLVEVQEHLGLTIVDVATWRVVPTPDLAIQFVHRADEQLIGVDTRVGESGVEDYYLLEVGDDGAVTHRGPFTTSAGWCSPTVDPQRLLCVQEGRAELVDLGTMQPISQLDIGYEDTIYGTGVLEDWLPSNLS